MKNIFLPGESGHLKDGARTWKSGDLYLLQPTFLTSCEKMRFMCPDVPISVCPWSHLEESYNLKSVYPHSTSQRFLVKVNLQFSSVQSFSHVRLFATPWTATLPVHHQLPEFTQTHVHWVSNAIQPSHPLPSPSPPAFNLAQHQDLFQWVSSSHQVLEFEPKYWSFSFSISPSNEYSGLISFRMDWITYIILYS